MPINPIIGKNSSFLTNALKKRQSFLDKQENFNKEIKAFETKVKDFLGLLNSLNGDDPFSARNRDRQGRDELAISPENIRAARQAFGRNQEVEARPEPRPKPQAAPAPTTPAAAPTDPSARPSVVTPTAPDTGATTVIAASGGGTATVAPTAGGTTVLAPTGGDSINVEAPTGGITVLAPVGTDTGTPAAPTGGDLANDGGERTRTEVRDVALRQLSGLFQEVRDLDLEIQRDNEITEEDIVDRGARFEGLRGQINDIVQNTQFNGESLLQGGNAENANLTAAVSALNVTDLSTRRGQLDAVTDFNKIAETGGKATLGAAVDRFNTEINRLATGGQAGSSRGAAVREGLGRAETITNELFDLASRAQQDFFVDDQGNEVEVTDEVRGQLNDRFQSLRSELSSLVANTSHEGGSVLQGGDSLNANLAPIAEFLNVDSDISTQSGAESAFYDVGSARSIVGGEAARLATDGAELSDLSIDVGRGSRSFYWED